MELLPGWYAKFEPEIDGRKLRLVKSPAWAECMFFRFGSNKSDEILENYYLEKLRVARSSGYHVDDLSEDCEFEYLAEAENTPLSTKIHHRYFRLCLDVIIDLTLNEYSDTEEIEVNQMLSTLQRFENDSVLDLGEAIILEPTRGNWNQFGRQYFVGAS